MPTVLPWPVAKGKLLAGRQFQFHTVVTNQSPEPVSTVLSFPTMKTQVGDYDCRRTFRQSLGKPVRRKTVSQILRAAYRKHMRDRETERALKHCLR
jgi:hypothetical protein